MVDLARLPQKGTGKRRQIANTSHAVLSHGEWEGVNLFSEKFSQKTYPPPDIGFNLYFGFVHNRGF